MTEDSEARDVLAAEEFALPAPDPALHQDEAHDVLAAEEFALPAPDPDLHREDPHDVLAAEEFALPAPDPVLAAEAESIELPADPADPAGVEPAHDVLAAEEFAVPGTAPHAVPPDFAAPPRREDGRSRPLIVGLAAFGLLGLRRLLRRRDG